MYARLTSSCYTRTAEVVHVQRCETCHWHSERKHPRLSQPTRRHHQHNRSIAGQGHQPIMRQSTSTQKSPRPSARRMTESSQLTGRPKSSRRTVRGASVSSTNTARAAGPPPTVLSDVFEIVADGNADVLADMIAFSGAQHMSELRSKKPEDYGRNLLHCAVANGQLGTLQVLLKHEGFDPNQARWHDA